MLLHRSMLKVFKSSRVFSSSSVIFNVDIEEDEPKPIPARSKRLPQSREISFLSPDFIRILQTRFDLSRKGIRRWVERKKEDMELMEQRVDQKLYRIVGKDICAAHFVVARGGSVKFAGEDRWNKLKEKKKDDKENDDDEEDDPLANHVLPFHFVPGLFVEAINAKNMTLYYEGLEHFEGLSKLRWLSLEGCPHVDDWFLDRVSSIFSETLEYLDLSHCKNISHRGLSCFYRFQKLKVLKVNGISDSPEFRLSCVMLEEMNPAITVEGVSYVLKDLSVENSKEGN